MFMFRSLCYNFSILLASLTHHICTVDRGGHLDFPVVLAVCELLVATDCSGAAAVV